MKRSLSASLHYLDILWLQQGMPGSNATLSPNCKCVTPGPTSTTSLQRLYSLMSVNERQQEENVQLVPCTLVSNHHRSLQHIMPYPTLCMHGESIACEWTTVSVAVQAKTVRMKQSVAVYRVGKCKGRCAPFSKMPHQTHRYLRSSCGREPHHLELGQVKRSFRIEDRQCRAGRLQGCAKVR